MMNDNNNQIKTNEKVSDGENTEAIQSCSGSEDHVFSGGHSSWCLDGNHGDLDADDELELNEFSRSSKNKVKRSKRVLNRICANKRSVKNSDTDYSYDYNLDVSEVDKVIIKDGVDHQVTSDVDTEIRGYSTSEASEEKVKPSPKRRECKRKTGKRSQIYNLQKNGGIVKKSKKRKASNNIFAKPLFCVKGLSTGTGRQVANGNTNYDSLCDKLTESKLVDSCDNRDFEFPPNIALHWKLMRKEISSSMYRNALIRRRRFTRKIGFQSAWKYDKWVKKNK